MISTASSWLSENLRNVELWNEWNSMPYRSLNFTFLYTNFILLIKKFQNEGGLLLLLVYEKNKREDNLLRLVDVGRMVQG